MKHPFPAHVLLLSAALGALMLAACAQSSLPSAPRTSASAPHHAAPQMVGTTPPWYVSPPPNPYIGTSNEGPILYGSPSAPQALPNANIALVEIDCGGGTNPQTGLPFPSCINWAGEQGVACDSPCNEGIADVTSFLYDLGHSGFGHYILDQYLTQGWSINVVGSQRKYVKYLDAIDAEDEVQVGPCCLVATPSAPVFASFFNGAMRAVAEKYPSANVLLVTVPQAITLCYNSSGDCYPGSNTLGEWITPQGGYYTQLEWGGWCGWHGRWKDSVTGKDYVVAYVMQMCSGEPNGTESTISHELIEAMTDPENNGNYLFPGVPNHDGVGSSWQEIGDACEGGTQQVNLYVNGYSNLYQIQPEYSNKDRGCYPWWNMGYIPPDPPIAVFPLAKHR